MRAQDVRVLAILVATNGEEWLPDCIRALHAQTHEQLDVIAVDNACTDASGRLLTKAFGGNAIVLDRRVGYGRALAAALKVAAEREVACDAFLLVHDDAAMEPDALAHMIDAMLADESIGIVGGKVLEWDDHSVLQEVGMVTDRYGRLFAKLERGELDHGQHDGLREVLFCTSAAMLVRRDLVERIGLFDPRYVAMRDDLDLSWRARLAGFRTVVTTDARSVHVSAAARGRRTGPVSGATRYFSERNRIATLLKNYSTARLGIVLPVVVLQSIVGSALFFARGRRRLARQVLGALEWNIVHAPSTLRARARARRHRRGSDADMLKLMVRGAPRLRGYVERFLETIVGEPVTGIEQAEIGGPVEGAPRRRFSTFIRAHPIGSVLAVLLLFHLIGARSLYGAGGLAGSGLLPFPSSSGSFFREFGSGWRSAGAAGAHPPGLAMLLLGALSTLALGSTWLASRVLLVSLLPAAAFTAFRCAGRLGLGPPARLASAAVYALSPLSLFAFGRGRLAELVLLAAAPALLLPVLAAAGLGDDSKPAWRSVAAGTAGLAVTAAVSPYAIPFVAASGVVVAATACFTAGRPLAALRAGLIMSAGAFALLFPWSFELLRSSSPLAAGGRDAASGMLDLARLAPPGAPLGILGWAFPAGALLGLALAGRRTRLAVTFATIAAASLLAAWGTGRASALGPRGALALTAAAFAYAALAGIAADAVGPRLRERSFGFGHFGAGVVALSLVAAMVGATGWLLRGRFPALERSGALIPTFIPADAATTGDFRLLWIGPAAAGGSRDDVRVDLTSPSGETMLSYGVRRSGAAVTFLERSVAAFLGGRSDQAGHVLAPLGVRHVIVRPGAPTSIESALERQSDLRFRQSFQGARVFDNLAWLPLAAPLAASNEWVIASRSDDPFAAVLSVDVSTDAAAGLHRRGPSRFEGRIDASAGAVVLAEAYDPKWRLFIDGRAVEPRRAFGFATAFDLPPPAGPSPAPTTTPRATTTATPRATTTPPATTTPRATVSPRATPGATPTRHVLIVWRGQSATRLLLLIQLAMWVVLLAWWSGRRALERGER